MDAQILQAIGIIDAKIASLQQARNTLASAFGITVPAAPIVPAPASSVPELSEVKRVPLRPLTAAPPDADREGAPTGRKEQLALFLVTHGALPRTSIVEQAGLPEGTVSYCLNDDRFFEQKPDGSWDITDFSRRGLEQKGLLNGTAH